MGPAWIATAAPRNKTQASPPTTPTTHHHQAGFTLSGLENLRLLSLAESLGLLSLAEKVLSTNGALIASSALLPFVAAIASLATLEEPTKYLVAAPLFLVTGGLFVTGNVIQGIMAEP